jgi:hypothetical protein
VAVWNATKEYYDTRAPEYDEWYLVLGRFAEREEQRERILNDVMVATR